MEHEKLVRVVCDYIAGMTDHYVQDVWKKLMAGKKAGVSDVWSPARNAVSALAILGGVRPSEAVT